MKKTVKAIQMTQDKHDQITGKFGPARRRKKKTQTPESKQKNKRQHQLFEYKPGKVNCKIERHWKKYCKGIKH